MTFDWEALQQAALVEERLAAGNYADAIAILREELKRRPDDDRVIQQLADAYAQVGQNDHAIRLLTLLAERYAAAERPEKSIAVMKKIVRLDPKQKEVYERIAAAIEAPAAGPEAKFDFLDVEEIAVEPPPAPALAAKGEETFSSRRPIHLADDSAVETAIPSPLFDSFSHEELLAVMRGLELQVFDPGDIIVTEGDAGDSLFILASGIVKAFVREGPKQRHVRTLHDGDFFGEISLLSGGRRTATVTAATHCELLELGRAAVDSIAATHPNVMNVLRQYYEERIRNA